LTDEELSRYLRRLYRIMTLYAAAGSVWYLRAQGPLPALGFLLGVLGSFGNLWLFNWLSRAMAPGESTQKPWQAGAFIGRYALLFTIGYVIVKGLGVSPLPVVLGLFASTAAVLAAAVFEMGQGLFRRGQFR
jgi:hypothetical protein